MVRIGGYVSEISTNDQPGGTFELHSFGPYCQTVWSLFYHDEIDTLTYFAHRLPEIQDELEKSIYKTRDLLVQLPREPSQQPVNEVATLLHEFVADLARHIAGVPDEKGLIQCIRPAQERFRREIRSTAPKFRSYEKRFAGTRKMPRAEFLDHEDGEDSEDDDDRECTALESRKRKRSPGVVYVDEVFERAQRCVASSPWQP